ncbi:MAG: hypothetical protein A4S16_05465 [Proteobacteria bacterium SG_bin6]|nr:MAG: hypothetical protein A4S16_05465 [Proteobacteria bacterium SG_bin6]
MAIDQTCFDRMLPGARARVLALAERALAHHVDLLGSGEIVLGDPIDWHRDFKSGERWAPAFCKDIAYNDLDRPTDVKVPWELSRMQWMIPLGQAYLLSGDERYAAELRRLIEHWIAENPYAASVNWACTMDVALRAICWLWFSHAVGHSESWSDRTFRAKFLENVYLHGDFISRHLEKSDVNGNHYTADAAGLAMIGQFLSHHPKARRWCEEGWAILSAEIMLQVFPDGVDFEASVPYHRLVLELFLWPALYRLRGGLPVQLAYRERLAAMARFTEAYSRPDGTAPLWGDADDARTLPFGGQSINDHRYLIGLVGLALDDAQLVDAGAANGEEVGWALGLEALARLPVDKQTAKGSIAFPEGGFYVLRDSRNHVFIDCGPLGLAGRGGHGHSDLLAFEAAIDGVTLVSDCGAYQYTANFRERNAFRSTAYHNTPQIDGEEIYRFFGERDLWSLRDDGAFEALEFKQGAERSSFAGIHHAYGRLEDPVSVWRRFELDHRHAVLTIEHRFDCQQPHSCTIPFHFAIGVEAELSDGAVRLVRADQSFTLRWTGPGWRGRIMPARVSPSYGVAVPTMKLVLECDRDLQPLTVALSR